jgi:16S rRNA (cytidine1402-2'-O)-methyltransferase
MSEEEIGQLGVEEEDLRPIPEQVASEMAAGYDKKEAMKRVAKVMGLSKRDVYQAMLENLDGES